MTGTGTRGLWGGAALAALCIGCGGAPNANDLPLPENPGPQVAILAFGGDYPTGAPEPYLATIDGTYSAAIYLRDALVAAGYGVDVREFVDSRSGRGGLYPGYDDAIEYLRNAGSNWMKVKNPTRIVTICHSHGGVWSHALSRDVPEVPIRLQLDFEASSPLWDYFHPDPNDRPGMNPEDAFDLPYDNTCGFPEVTNEPGTLYDMEDVVFESVRDAWEVRIMPGPCVIFCGDGRWNIRPDGSTTGLHCFYNPTSHFETVTPGGTTLIAARDWILARLAEDDAAP